MVELDSKEKRKIDQRHRAQIWTREHSVREIATKHTTEIKNPDRRESCARDLKKWLLTYTPEPFDWGFSKDHDRLLSLVQEVVLESGCSVIAMPRGSGKTTILQRALVWSAINGHRKFPVIGTASQSAFVRVISGIKTILETNELLLEDYPEVIYPIRALEGVTVRANYQLWESKPTYIKWGTDEVQFATTPYSIERGNAGVIMAGGGITGALRGMMKTLPDGTSVRPDLLLVDDPQTRMSAKSHSQTTEREDILNGDLLGLAGGKRKIAAFCTCTVIYENDLAERLLDNKRSINWSPLRVPTFYQFPTNMKLWEEYDNLRRQELLNELEEGSATKFYVEHREKLDEGCVHYWPDRCEESCVSAVQTAMNEYFDKPSHVFASEYQNQPEAHEDDMPRLMPNELAARGNGYERGEVPISCDTVTVHIDVQQNILFWAAVAWNRDTFGGYVIDYDTWPKRNRRYFTLKQIKYGLEDLYPEVDESGRLQSAVIDCVKHVNREWRRGDTGASVATSRILVDGGWRIESIEAGVKRCGAANVAVAIGRGIKATQQPMQYWAKREGETKGNHWVSRAIRHGRPIFMFDANYWKTQVHQGLLLDKNHGQAISFFEEPASFHQMFAEHCCAENATKVSANGRVVAEWQITGSTKDNHFFDNLVGAMAGASYLGISKPNEHRTPAPRRRRRGIKPLKL